MHIETHTHTRSVSHTHTHTHTHTKDEKICRPNERDFFRKEAENILDPVAE